MILYIDFRNLLNLFSLRKQERDGGIVQLLKNELEIHALFPASLFESESKSNEEYQYYLRLSEDWNIRYMDADLVHSPLRDFFFDESISFAERRKRLCSVYLLDIENKEDKSCVDYLRQYVLIDGLGNEKALLSRLYNDRERHLITQHRVYSRGCNCWRELKGGMAMPATDVLIHDRYLFKSISGGYGRNRGINSFMKLFEDNSPVSRVRAEEPLPMNMVIFSLMESGKESRQRLDSFVSEAKSRFRGRRLNLTFILYEGSLRQCHDRFILTNYKRFDTGDSFHNLFTGNTEGDNRSLFESSTAVRNYQKNFVEDTLGILQREYENVAKHYGDNIIGDKVSNLIDFR